MKKALITGITGQDGSYLAEFLLKKATRSMASSAARAPSTRAGSITFIRIRMIRTASASCIYGDLNDASSLEPHHAHGAARRDL